jgi:hypothetical protein
VDRAAKFQPIRQIATTIFLCAAAIWFSLKPSAPELNIECTIIILGGLIAAVCTAKVSYRIDRSTRMILQAIADLHRE